MYYTIYKTTNLINGKFYIGKHQTKDLNDGYLGSGKLLKRAINKYGLDNFHKEILYVCESEKQMNALEKILVVPDPELNYNLCTGGHGGFGYINESLKLQSKGRKAADIILSNRYGKNWRTIQGRIGGIAASNSPKWQKSMKNKIGKTFDITSPLGEVILTNNLSKFCQENNLIKSHMYQVAKKSKGYISHRGWSCREI